MAARCNQCIQHDYYQELFPGSPKELEEASHIDGASDLTIFLKVVLPLSKPVLASVGLFYAVGHWNAYFNSLLYIDNVNMKVVQQVLREVMQQAQQAETDELMDWGSNGAPPSKAVRMASTVVATVPDSLCLPIHPEVLYTGCYGRCS